MTKYISFLTTPEKWHLPLAVQWRKIREGAPEPDYTLFETEEGCCVVLLILYIFFIMMMRFGKCINLHMAIWKLTLMLLATPAVNITYALAIVHPVRPAYSHCRHEFMPAVWIGLLQAQICACSVQKVNQFFHLWTLVSSAPLNINHDCISSLMIRE